MRSWQLLAVAVLLISLDAKSAGASLPQNGGETSAHAFAANGVIEEIKPDGKTVVIKHGAVSNYMDAMTMPFKVKDAKELAGLRRGDEISFQLHVTGTESWVGQITKTGAVSLPQNKTGPEAPPVSDARALLDYKFTNELGQAASLGDFRGQALAITFFYTRCPLPDYCPRLSKNFQEASQKLEAMTNAPANWHFISVSFDTEFDSPETLKAYGESYAYDPAHWSFLTGPPDKIGELARACGVTFESSDGTINHNFRTLIIDAAGHLQMIFPTSGDLSDQITAQILKAAAVTNQSAGQNHNR
ncbi:MAG TPA: SCO family protein [Verrucomicrobiae bacterium]|jgi:protein SCO1/2